MQKIRCWLLGLLLVGSDGVAAEGEAAGSLVWHGNVTNADRAVDRLAAWQWQGGLETETGGLLPGRSAWRAGWHVELELWPRYQGLDTIATGPQLAWNHKFGLGSQAPVFAVRGAGDGVAARESARAGRGGKLLVQMQKRFGPAWRIVTGIEWEKYRARGHAFNRAGREYFLRTEYQAGPGWALALELRQRHGDVVSYSTPPRPDLVEAGHVLTFVDTFERRAPLLAYYFPADTRSAAVKLTRVLDATTTAFLRFEYRATNHNTVRYLNQRLAAGISRRF